MSHPKWCISEWHPTRDDCTCGAALTTLARNLAVAGGLCHSFALGESLETQLQARMVPDPYFAPGCGRSAPGWTREEGR